MTHTQVGTAHAELEPRTTQLRSIEFRQATGRAVFRFRANQLDHDVHALYHLPPELPQPVWRACLEELALACFVDISTAAMAERAETDLFTPSRTTRVWFRRACDALRIELLYDEQRSLNLLPLRFRGLGQRQKQVTPVSTSASRILLLMGGGKDSLYTYDLLLSAGYDVTCFYVTEARRTWQQLRRVWESLDGKVSQYRVYLDVNRHGPIGRYYGERYLSQFQLGQIIAASLPYALALGCRFIAAGLEKSADEPMVKYNGRNVNHQDQKSTDSIRLLNRHLAWRFGGSVQIVSPAKGLYDLGIYSRLLAKAPSLIRLQSSCGGANSVSPHGGTCAKCAFLAALLAGLSPDRSLYDQLFRIDPLKNPTLYGPWLDTETHRPLTCAGLEEEVTLALILAKRRRNDLDWFLPNRSILAKAKRTLRHLLRAHKNPLLPASMAKRLGPYFDYDEGELEDLLSRPLL